MLPVVAQNLAVWTTSVARKVLKKFESMNVTFVRDEITGLINYIDKAFGKAEMEDSKSYLRRIQNLY